MAMETVAVRGSFRYDDGSPIVGKTVTFAADVNQNTVALDEKPDPSYTFTSNDSGLVNGTLPKPRSAAYGSANWVWTVTVQGERPYTKLIFGDQKTFDLGDDVYPRSRSGAGQEDIDEAIENLPFRSDNVDTTGAQVGVPSALVPVSGGGFELAPAQRDLASFVTLGDSRTQLNANAAGLNAPSSSGSIVKENRGYVTQAMVMLRQRMRWLENGGVGGDTTAQMLARTDALLALNPGWLIGFGAINSVNAGVSSAQIISELTQIFDKCAARGVRVVWGTDWISGGTNTTAKRLVAGEVNAWLRSLVGTRADFYLVDYGSVMGDAATGIVPTSLGQDQLHQDAPGAYLMAKELAKVLGPLVPPSDRLLTSNADPTNGLLNGMMLGNTSGRATSWSGGSAAASAWSKVTRTDGVPGEWQQVVCTAETASSLSQQIAIGSTPFAEGDKVACALEFETDASGWNVTEFTLQLQYIGGAAASSSNPKVVNDMVTAATSPLALPRIESGVLRTPGLIIGAGATHLQVSIRLKGTGTYRVSRVRLAKTN